MWQEIRTAVEPGLIYAIGTLGLALSFRFLRFPDFTTLGSIMLGGVATAYLTQHAPPPVAVLGGAAVGGFAGLFTGLLAGHLRINPVLAGVITFTGSYTFGFLFCSGSSEISLPYDLRVFLTATFTLQDAVFITALLLILILGLSLAMTTKLGGYLLAMTAHRNFVSFRHRHQEGVTIWTLIIANALVALAGSLYALNDRGASVYSHQDFLPLALAAIFAADAVIKWAGATIYKYRFRPPELIGRTSKLSKFFAGLFFVERDDTPRAWLIFSGYAIGCVIFTILSRSIYVGVLDRWVPISHEWQYLAVALLMTAFVWWSSLEEEA